MKNKNVEFILNEMKKAMLSAVLLYNFALWIKKKYPHLYEEWKQEMEAKP